MFAIELKINGEKIRFPSVYPPNEVAEADVASMVLRFCEDKWGKGTLTKLPYGNEYSYQDPPYCGVDEVGNHPIPKYVADGTKRMIEMAAAATATEEMEKEMAEAHLLPPITLKPGIPVRSTMPQFQPATPESEASDLELYGSAYTFVADDGRRFRVDPTKMVVKKSNPLLPATLLSDTYTSALKQVSGEMDAESAAIAGGDGEPLPSRGYAYAKMKAMIMGADPADGKDRAIRTVTAFGEPVPYTLSVGIVDPPTADESRPDEAKSPKTLTLRESQWVDLIPNGVEVGNIGMNIVKVWTGASGDGDMNNPANWRELPPRAEEARPDTSDESDQPLIVG